MEESSIRILRVCRSFVIWITIIGGFLLWIFLPDYVPVHFGLTFSPDRMGKKTELLILIILPLLAYIPLSTPEFHIDSEETRLAINKKKKLNEIIHLIIAIILSFIVWIPLFVLL